MTQKSKNELLRKVLELVEEEGCYQDVMSVVNLGWSRYKGKIDENLNAIYILSQDLISKEKAKQMIENEHTPGNLNLSMFPNFRENIVKISKLLEAKKK